MTTIRLAIFNPSGTVEGCGLADCDPKPVDVLCRDHGALLVFKEIPPRTRYVLGVLACALIWAAFFAAPALNNIVPTFVVLALAGAGIVVLPLRTFPVAGRSILAGWIIACALAPVLDRPHHKAFQIVATVIVFAIAIGWAVRLSRSAADLNKRADSSGGVAGAAFVAAGLAIAAVTALLWLLTGPPGSDPATHLPAALRAPLIWSVRVMLGVTVVAWAGFAAGLGTDAWRDRGLRLIKPPSRPRRLARWGADPASAARGPQAVDRIIEGVFGVMVQFVLAVLDVLIGLLYYRILGILVAVANWLLSWLAAMVTIVVRAAVLLRSAAWSATRVIAIPAVSLLVAAVLMLSFTHAHVDYVKTGSLADVGLLLGCAAASYVLLTLAWTALSAVQPSILSAAIVNFTGPTLAITIVLALIGGWGFGILGAAGYGPYHIGWLTIGCTTLVAVAVIVWGLRRRSLQAGEDEIDRLAPLAARRGAGDATVPAPRSPVASAADNRSAAAPLGGELG
ncbi:hypothetical protein [Rugosimonospora africana]|uniref:Uncharacterized protein n=1 Tax=Rugosimonospora africana TaxID=556532 RepID=A0A8J3VRW1_9ACTN|nr:hypothetical protein [Rugosimonospora africana]GIH16645.1 hypothetical protein Raf01_48170 [Rugosimonospora africana]